MSGPLNQRSLQSFLKRTNLSDTMGREAYNGSAGNILSEGGLDYKKKSLVIDKMVVLILQGYLDKLYNMRDNKLMNR